MQFKKVTQTFSGSPTSPGPAGGSLEPYVWDTSKKQKLDTFFAVPNIVIDAPKTEIDTVEGSKVYISF